jgi:hypothetical protein
MRIRALQTFTIALPDRMVVLNAAKGKVKADEADIADEVAQQYIDAGMAAVVRGKTAPAAEDQPADDAKSAKAGATDAAKDDASNEAAPAAEDKAP